MVDTPTTNETACVGLRTGNEKVVTHGVGVVNGSVLEVSSLYYYDHYYYLYYHYHYY